MPLLTVTVVVSPYELPMVHEVVEINVTQTVRLKLLTVRTL
jgi:hypothetical protein